MPKDKEIKKLSEEDVENTSGGVIAYMDPENTDKIELYDDKGNYLTKIKAGPFKKGLYVSKIGLLGMKEAAKAFFSK